MQRDNDSGDLRRAEDLDEPERTKIIDELRGANLLPAERDPRIENLLITTYLRGGGLPSRYVNAAEGTHAIPDMTTTDEDLAFIDELEDLAERRNSRRPWRRGTQ